MWTRNEDMALLTEVKKQWLVSFFTGRVLLTCFPLISDAGTTGACFLFPVEANWFSWWTRETGRPIVEGRTAQECHQRYTTLLPRFQTEFVAALKRGGKQLGFHSLKELHERDNEAEHPKKKAKASPSSTSADSPIGGAKRTVREACIYFLRICEPLARESRDASKVPGKPTLDKTHKRYLKERAQFRKAMGENGIVEVQGKKLRIVSERWPTVAALLKAIESNELQV